MKGCNILKQLSSRCKRKVAGVMFVTPWLIGIILFFLQSIINLFRYSFSNFKFTQNGGYILQSLKNGIFENYVEAFTKDALYPQKLLESLKDILYKVPVILVFSIFVAIILNQSFKGRTLMRGIFFIPVLISSGVVASVIKTSLTSTVIGTDTSNNIFSAALLMQTMEEMGLPDQIVTQVGKIVSNVTDLVWGSSVQIIIFLMGLLTIPKTYYEVANVEGATAWEAFWKVTFPAVSPYIMVNIVYTSIDQFTNYDNSVMKYIMDIAFKDFKYSYSSALMWIYFVIIIIIIAIILSLTSLLVASSESKKYRRRKI